MSSSTPRWRSTSPTSSRRTASSSSGTCAGGAETALQDLEALDEGPTLVVRVLPRPRLAGPRGATTAVDLLVPVPVSPVDLVVGDPVDRSEVAVAVAGVRSQLVHLDPGQKSLRL